MWWGSLLLLAALTAGAVIESFLAFGESAHPTRLWGLYLAAHSFCYAFILSSPDDLPRWRRARIAGSFAGAMMLATAAMNAGIGFAVANGRAMDFLAVWPITLLVGTVLAAVSAVGLGLGYGLCIAVGLRIWFPHRARDFLPAAVWHALWGMAANLIVVSAIAWTQLRLAFGSAPAIGSYLSVAAIMWLVSMPHLLLAWRTSKAWGDMEAPSEPPRPIHVAGLAVSLALPLLFLWSLSPGQMALSLGGSVEEIRVGDETYHVPTQLIRKRHLDNISELDRRWVLLRMRLGGSDDPSNSGLEAMTFNVHVVEEPVRNWQNPVESLNCAGNLFGTMSGCWTQDAKDWDGAYPFAKPSPDSVFEFNPPHVVSRIDIVVLDGRRRYQALLNGLTGHLYLDDGQATWHFHVPDDMLKDLDKIIIAARAFQEQLKQDQQASSDPS